MNILPLDPVKDDKRQALCESEARALLSQCHSSFSFISSPILLICFPLLVDSVRQEDPARHLDLAGYTGEGTCGDGR